MNAKTKPADLSHRHLKAQLRAHTQNSSAIIAAIFKGQKRPTVSLATAESDYAKHPGLMNYQRYLLNKFADIICKKSFDYISKTSQSWLIVGDRRQEIAANISLIIERHGLGIGMLVLHAQQIHAQHILSQITENGHVQNLAIPTECLHGAHGEHVMSIPIRKFRGDFNRLAELNIAKPKNLWDISRIVTHESDQHPCFYCSCAEINPAEVVVDLDGSSHGLSRQYSLGFTFAPFGNPLSTVHFLAWDRARKPLNMNRVPMTVSDLVKLTREMNLSIRTYFAETGIKDYPVIDGISNGWAGNTIYHQHFQFFCPEHPAPVLQARASGRRSIIQRDDLHVQRLRWPTPVYRIQADDALNTGLVGNDLAGIWRLKGGSRKVPYKQFRDGYTPAEGEKIHAHTQNLYVPGCKLGDTAYLVLRDRERIDFLPGAGEWVNPALKRQAQQKKNIGVIEATGAVIVDDRHCFDEMKPWSPDDISNQVRMMINAIAPDEAKVTEFETVIRDLFPQ